MRPLLSSTITFAHRGGQADAPANSREAFVRAVAQGAGGLETDTWLTADGIAVLDHDGRVRGGWRRRLVRDVTRATLPSSMMTIDDLYAACPGPIQVSVDLKDPGSLDHVVAAATRAGPGSLRRLWLCHPDWEWLASARERAGEARLVHSTSIRSLREGPERHAARLAEAGIDCVNLHVTDWSGGLTTLYHRFGRLAFGWDAQHERQLRELARMGIDGVYSDHVGRMVDVFGPTPPAETSGGGGAGASEQADRGDGPHPDEGPADDEAFR